MELDKTRDKVRVSFFLETKIEVVLVPVSQNWTNFDAFKIKYHYNGNSFENITVHIQNNLQSIV